MVRQAVALEDAGAPRPGSKAAPRAAPDTPGFLRDALAREPAAQATFDAFPPSQRREYIDWLQEAKQPATRERRLAQALEWLAEGKRRHWKYQR